MEAAEMRVCGDATATQQALLRLRESVPALTRGVSSLVARGGGVGVGGGVGDKTLAEALTETSAVAAAQRVVVEELLDAARRVEHARLRVRRRQRESGGGGGGGGGSGSGTGDGEGEGGEGGFGAKGSGTGDGEGEGGEGGFGAKAKERALSRPLDAGSAERMSSLLRLGAGVDACADSVERHAGV